MLAYSILRALIGGAIAQQSTARQYSRLDNKEQDSSSGRVSHFAVIVCRLSAANNGQHLGIGMAYVFRAIRQAKRVLIPIAAVALALALVLVVLVVLRVIPPRAAWRLQNERVLQATSKMGSCSYGLEVYRDTAGFQCAIRLSFKNRGIKDRDLTNLAGLGRIVELDLSGTDISDIGLQQIATISDLEELRIANTRVTNNGLIALTALSRLAVLDLSGTGVTDDAWLTLGRCPSLASVYADDTAISYVPKGIELILQR